MKYFGTDGIRGRANVTLMPELAYKVGQSLALLNNKNLLIGWDTRISSVNFVEKIMEGALSVGIDVHLLGVIPTPGLIMASKDLSMTAIMVTASHNPYYDNGIKVVKEGLKISFDDKKKIEDYIDGKIYLDINNKGKSKELEYKDKYFSFLLEHSVKTNKKIVFDCANGAGSSYVKIYKKVVPELKILANEPNGYNINENVGATHLDNIMAHIEGYDLGISIDGDGDRFMVVDKNKIYDGDKIIYIFARYFKKKQMLKNNTVVLTKMSNLGIINQLKAEGINVILTDVGDQNVIEEMKKGDFSLGGENSGHIITPYFLTGDGLLNGLVLLRILEEENATLEKLTENVEMYFDKTINIRVNDKSIIADDSLNKKVKKITENFGKYGKVVIRASGTEDLIRITVMHKEKDVMEKYLEELVELVNTLNRE